MQRVAIMLMLRKPAVIRMLAPMGHQKAKVMQNCLTSKLVLSLALVTSGCSHAMNDSDIKQNPHPKQRYEITVTIDGAPGSFDSVNGYMQYNIVNDYECVPSDPLTGGRGTPEYTPSISLIRASSNSYSGVIYLDLAMDDDYYGKGACHWKMIGANLGLVANGVTMTPRISYDEIVSQSPVTLYMAKSLYHGSDVKNLNAAAVPMSDYIAKNRDKFFSITLSAKEGV